MVLRIYTLDADYKMGSDPAAELIDPILSNGDGGGFWRVAYKADAESDVVADDLVAAWVTLHSADPCRAYLSEKPFRYYDGHGIVDARDLGWPTLPLSEEG
jgi:hypothetical protein